MWALYGWVKAKHPFLWDFRQIIEGRKQKVAKVEEHVVYNSTATLVDNQLV
jgi:hypothetical protein